MGWVEAVRIILKLVAWLTMSHELREFRRAARRANSLVEHGQSDEAWRVVRAEICKLIPGFEIRKGWS